MFRSPTMAFRSRTWPHHTSLHIFDGISRRTHSLRYGMSGQHQTDGIKSATVNAPHRILSSDEKSCRGPQRRYPDIESAVFSFSLIECKMAFIT